MLEQVVSVRVARRIASCTMDLSAEAVKQADRMVCADPARIGPVRAERLIDEVRLWFDPDRAVDEEQKALARRGVWKHQAGAPATVEMSLVLDALDAQRFDRTVGDLAAVLSGLGDGDDLDVRRARAVGLLADPQAAADLLNGHHHPPVTSGPVTMFVHVAEESLARTPEGAGPVTVEKVGVVSTGLVRDWLTGATVVVRPVLDLNRTETVSAHDPPEWMRELVIERDGHCVFPGCRRDSRACDLDHIQPYDIGGPTTPGNLAPLCRMHHRAKTHAAYDYTRDPDGSYRWTLPTGTRIRVIPTSRKPSTP